MCHLIPDRSIPPHPFHLIVGFPFKPLPHPALFRYPETVELEIGMYLLGLVYGFVFQPSTVSALCLRFSLGKLLLVVLPQLLYGP